MKKIIRAAVAAYLTASLALSVSYNLLPGSAWEIATHRNGLLCAGIAPGPAWGDIWILSPFDNYGDSFLAGVMWDADGVEFYSDGRGLFWAPEAIPGAIWAAVTGEG